MHCYSSLARAAFHRETKGASTTAGLQAPGETVKSGLRGPAGALVSVAKALWAPRPELGPSGGHHTHRTWPCLHCPEPGRASPEPSLPGWCLSCRVSSGDQESPGTCAGPLGRGGVFTASLWSEQQGSLGICRNRSTNRRLPSAHPLHTAPVAPKAKPACVKEPGQRGTQEGQKEEKEEEKEWEEEKTRHVSPDERTHHHLALPRGLEGRLMKPLISAANFQETRAQSTDVQSANPGWGSTGARPLCLRGTGEPVNLRRRRRPNTWGRWQRVRGTRGAGRRPDVGVSTQCRGQMVCHRAVHPEPVSF